MRLTFVRKLAASGVEVKVRTFLQPSPMLHSWSASSGWGALLYEGRGSFLDALCLMCIWFLKEAFHGL